MKNIRTKALCTLMIATALLGFAAVFPIHAVIDTGDVYIDPILSSFTTATKGVGDTFIVNVTVNNFQVGDGGATYGNNSLFGLSFKLSWDTTLLNCTAAQEILFHTITPEYDWTNIWNLNFKINNTAGTFDYAQLWQSSAQAIANGYAPANITSATTAAMLTFKILRVPTMSEGILTCPLHLSGVKAGDVGAVPLPINVVDGTYEIIFALPNFYPYFSVTSHTSAALNEEFDIYVYVNNLSPAWEAVGFEFKLGYNSSLLALLSVTPGPWLPPYGADPNQGTLNLTMMGSNFVQHGQVIMPDANGTWHAPFPSSPNPNTVAFAILHFKSIAQGTGAGNILSCALNLYDTKVANWLGEPVTNTEPVDGFYSISPKVFGRVIDIFVGQDGVPYPFPYGGQGPMAPADMFWPQKQVCAWAYVTYNDWPEQMKDVALQIIDNHQNTWGVIFGRTNADGYAEVCFRLPWPCDNPEQYIGVWTIIGTVDVACTIVNDTVMFHYDYLVEIYKVTTDATSYAHLDCIDVNVTYGSHRQQPMNVTIMVTGLDETGVPFDFAYLTVPLPGTVFCQLGNDSRILTICIPKFARAGVATIEVAFLDDWPWMGGTVQSGFYYAGPEPPPIGWYGYGFTTVNILAE